MDVEVGEGNDVTRETLVLIRRKNWWKKRMGKMCCWYCGYVLRDRLERACQPWENGGFVWSFGHSTLDVWGVEGWMAFRNNGCLGVIYQCGGITTHAADGVAHESHQTGFHVAR